MNTKILSLQNRIELLRNRAGRENGKIIKKLLRRIRALENKTV